MDIYSLSDFVLQQRIGEKLKSLRLKQNITQASLADRTHVSLSSVKKIERGQICSFDSLIRILRELGKLDVLQQLVEDDIMSPNEYYEFVNAQKKKRRKRASATKGNTGISNTDNEDSTW